MTRPIYKYAGSTAEAEAIRDELARPGDCTSRTGYNREKAFAMRPVLGKVLNKAGYVYKSRLDGTTLIVWRVA